MIVVIHQIEVYFCEVGFQGGFEGLQYAFVELGFQLYDVGLFGECEVQFVVVFEVEVEVGEDEELVFLFFCCGYYFIQREQQCLQVVLVGEDEFAFDWGLWFFGEGNALVDEEVAIDGSVDYRVPVVLLVGV